MFKINKRSIISSARLGEIKTKHGSVKTPFFMPDATRGFVKSLSNNDLKGISIGPMVVNTFHLYLSPKMELIGKYKGVHKFMNWELPLLSDSGGFQVFSLIHKNPSMGKINENNVIFRSPLDGSKHEFTPEKSIQIQFELGTDMIVCLDDCPPNDFDKESIMRSIERTIRWASKCKKEYDGQIKKRKIKSQDRPLIFAVVQGGINKDLRGYCAAELIKIGFDGYGYGARPVDADGNFLSDILKFTAESIPDHQLRFALGVGMPEDITKCVSYGWDMFDCVIPTREGRHGRLFSWKKTKVNNCNFNIKHLLNNKFYHIININNAQYNNDINAINEYSKIPDLRNYSKGFLNYLFKTKDPLAQRLASLNNLEFYLELLSVIRTSIKKGLF